MSVWAALTVGQFYQYADCKSIVNNNKGLGHASSKVIMNSQLCKGTFKKIQVSDQWYYRGFITFCVVHEASESWAFFGYQAQLILNSIVPCMYVSDSFRVGTYNDTDLPPGYLGGSKAEQWPDIEVWTEPAEPAAH